MQDKQAIVNEVIEKSDKLLSILNNFDIKDNDLTAVKKLLSDFKQANTKENLEKLDKEEIEKLNSDAKVKLAQLESLLSLGITAKGK